MSQDTSQSPNPLIGSQAELESLCQRLRRAKLVAFDTEFVSEYTYRPELCLLQFATETECVAVDPYEVDDLSCWWDVMTDDETTVVVHGGQAEVRFCLDLAQKVPSRLVDVQIAEGLRSRSYPLGYESLVSRVLGTKVHGKETRTDWRRRPLSAQQIRYALDDVSYILKIWKRQRDSLDALNRTEWAQAEFQRMIDEIASDATRQRWLKLSGLHKLGRRELAIAREVYEWREAEAIRKNCPPRRILRDDLILELARRRPRNAKELLATRDMNRPNYKRSLPQFLECVDRGVAVPQDELPEVPKLERGEQRGDEHVLGQLLGIALSNRCADMNVARQLVGTSADLRHLVRWHIHGDRSGNEPRLSTGWRAEVCGRLLTDLLDGRISLRVGNPKSDHPLVFEEPK